MATKVNTSYEIDRRYWAYKRLCRMRKIFIDVPPIEIYGLNIKGEGLITRQEIINFLK